MKQTIKRFTAFVSALALSLSSLFVLAVPAAHAADFTYDGGVANSTEAGCTDDLIDPDCYTLGAAPVLAGPHTLTISAATPVGHRVIDNTITGLELSTLTFYGAFGSESVVLDSTGNGVEPITISGAGIANQTTGSTTNPHIINSDIVFDGTTAAVSIANGTNTTNKLSIIGDIQVIGAGTTLTLGGAEITDPITQDSSIEIGGVISGGGKVVISTGVAWFMAANTYTGDTTVQSGGSLVLSGSSAGDNTAGTTVVDGGSIKFAGTVGVSATAEAYTIAGYGNLQFDSGIGALVTGALNVTLTDVTLTADAGICSTNAANTLEVTAPTLGGFVLSRMDNTECPGTETADSTELPLYSGTPTPPPTGPTNCPTGPSSCPSATNGMTIADGEGAKLDSNITGPITVNGTLFGSGTITGAVNVGATGTVSPGLSPGCINVAGALTFVSGSSYDVEMQGTTACTDYDQTVVTGGAVALAGATLNLSFLNSFVPTVGNTFTIIDGDQAISGQFSQGTTITAGGVTFSINYQGGGDGFDVVLTVTDVAATPTPTPTPTPTATPTTPDTGFAALMTNPATVMFSTTAIAGAILAIARKYNLLKG